MREMIGRRLQCPAEQTAEHRSEQGRNAENQEILRARGAAFHLIVIGFRGRY